MSTKMTEYARTGKIGPIQDAVEAIYITASDIDVVRGTQFAPDQCVLAKAACRAHGTNAYKAWFYRHAVYVARIDIKKYEASRRAHQKAVRAAAKKGVHLNTAAPLKFLPTLRYMPSKEARSAIEIFDKTGQFPPGRFRLDAPSGCHTLKAIAARNANRPNHHPRDPRKLSDTIRGPKAATRGRLQYAFAG